MPSCCFPFADSDQVSRRRARPACMPEMPVSQLLMTSPLPNVNRNRKGRQQLDRKETIQKKYSLVTESPCQSLSRPPIFIISHANSVLFLQRLVNAYHFSVTFNPPARVGWRSRCSTQNKAKEVSVILWDANIRKEHGQILMGLASITYITVEQDGASSKPGHQFQLFSKR